MKYKVVFTAESLKQLKKLDKYVAKFITTWIEKNLEGCENPRQYGKNLVANRNGQWRYRIGDYRLIAEILDKEIVILIVNVGHRKNIYTR